MFGSYVSRKDNFVEKLGVVQREGEAQPIILNGDCVEVCVNSNEANGGKEVCSMCINLVRTSLEEKGVR